MNSKLKHVLKSPWIVDGKSHSSFTYSKNMVQVNLVSKICFCKMPHVWQKMPKKGEKSFFWDKKRVGNKREKLFCFGFILVDNTKVQLETIGPLLGFDFLIS